MGNKSKLHNLVRVWGVFFLLGFSSIFIVIDLYFAYHYFNNQAQETRTGYIDRHKQSIQQEVSQAVKMIQYRKAQSEKLTKEKIKSRVYEAYAIVRNIYEQNKDTEDRSKIQQMFIDALRPVRFENGAGYYFATTLDGVVVLHADIPETEGLNFADLQDTRGRYVIREMIEIAKADGEGFYEYYWTKPNQEGSDYKKMSFIKLFAPYDLYIATGLYVDDVESRIKEELLSDISRIRFGKEGYIFINSFDGDALVSNGRMYPGNQKLWELFDQDPQKMKDIFDKELDAALKPEGDFIYYSFIKLSDNEKEVPKVSFIFGIPELQWLVGSGFYVDDVEKDIAEMQIELNRQLKEKIYYYLLTAAGIVVLFFLIFNRLNHRFRSDINYFIEFFQRAAHSDEEIDRERIRFQEFDQAAICANKMLMDRKQAEETLRESEERFRTLFNNASEGIIVAEVASGRLSYVNPAICKMLGYPEEELVGMTVADIHPKEFLEDVVSEFEALGKGEKQLAAETPCLRKDGEIIYADINAGRAIIRGVECNIGLFTDITDRKRDEEKRKELQNQLFQSQKMESVGRLAGGVAHDYNNMLSIIIGYVESAMGKVSSESSVFSDLEEILVAANRSADITRQLLAFSRQQPINPKALDLNAAVKNLLNMLRRLISEDIDLVWSPGPDTYMVRIDPVQVNQVMVNLCVNARDAINSVGKIIIETGRETFDEESCSNYTGCTPGEFVRLTVSDNGCGLNKENMEKIFEPFFTTKEIGKGTGLGLATVYGIVKQNNGFINVHSELTKGTAIEIFLPVYRWQGAEPNDRDAMSTLSGCGETILLVEDDQSILKLGKRMLESLGYRVIGADTPSKAADIAKEYPESIHLLITDVVMPEMNGRDLADQLKSIYPELKILYMSGYTDMVIAQRGELEEGVAFIPKPFTKQELSGKIREVLDR